MLEIDPKTCPKRPETLPQKSSADPIKSKACPTEMKESDKYFTQNAPNIEGTVHWIS
jgi:hypothetical protein